MSFVAAAERLAGHFEDPDEQPDLEVVGCRAGRAEFCRRVCRAAGVDPPTVDDGADEGDVLRLEQLVVGRGVVPHVYILVESSRVLVWWDSGRRFGWTPEGVEALLALLTEALDGLGARAATTGGPESVTDEFIAELDQLWAGG